MTNTIVCNTTCFEEHRKRNLVCHKEVCRNWMCSPENLNCAILGVQSKETRTLQEIGDIFGVTRMRICQIEKKVLSKLKDVIEDT